MGLDNFFYTKKFNNVDTDDYVYDDDEYTLEPCLYGGVELLDKGLDAGVRSSGCFRGKLYSDLFDLLLEDDRFTLYTEDYVQKEELETIVAIMSWTKKHLLEENGELWWKNYLEEHLSSSYKEFYDYETTLSFILMFEWYSQQENVVLGAWF